MAILVGSASSCLTDDCKSDLSSSTGERSFKVFSEHRQRDAGKKPASLFGFQPFCSGARRNVVYSVFSGSWTSGEAAGAVSTGAAGIGDS